MNAHYLHYFNVPTTVINSNLFFYRFISIKKKFNQLLRIPTQIAWRVNKLTISSILVRFV